MLEVWEWIRAQHIVFIPFTENTDTVSVNGTREFYFAQSVKQNLNCEAIKKA